MFRFLALVVLIAFPGPLLADTDRPGKVKDLLITVSDWYAASEEVDPKTVKISPIDKRLRIPSCEFGYKIDFLYPSSNRNVVVSCPDTNWKLFLTITSEIKREAYAYKVSLSAGTLLTPDHFSVATTASSDSRVLDALKEIEGLSQPILVKDVRQGELIKTYHFDEGIEVFETLQDIQKNTFLTEKNVRTRYLGASKVSSSQRFLTDPLAGAKARRDLKLGSILSNGDINIRQKAVISTKPIYRGQAIDDDNITVGYTYGKLSKDSLSNPLDAENMEITRSVNAGEIIKTSDLRPAKMVSTGENVHLTVSKGMLTISVEMIAMGDGKIGDQVSLMNPESREIVPGIIVGKGKAKGL